MAVKTEKELSEDQRAHWLKAVAAIELRNFGYAISLLQGILKQEPQFLTGRQLLRRTEVTRLKAAKKKFFNVSTASMAVMKAQREMKKDAKRAVELIEKILENEPYNKQANLALKEAAVAAGWLETGVFALQTLLEENARCEPGPLARGRRDRHVDHAAVEPLDGFLRVRGRDLEVKRRAFVRELAQDRHEQGLRHVVARCDAERGRRRALELAEQPKNGFGLVE